MSHIANEAGYEWTRAFLENAAVKAGRATKKLTTLESMMAGAVAGSLTVLITNPIWVVNTRMTTMSASKEEPVLPTSSKLADQNQQKKLSTLGVAFKILREDGMTGFFAGVMPALVLVINPILQYTVFEQLKNILEKRRRVTPTDSFYMGALGKLVATSITYPYITVKSRMHVAASGKKEGMMTTLNNIVKNEGVAGLYGGKLIFDM
jgi:solute carrier family 25 (peroxisomal adenine nucleotide transporter), member 17